MRTVQELYDEVMASQEMKAQFIEAANAGRQEEFLKAHGCEATLEEVAAFLKAKNEEDAPLSMDELENSAGGKCTAKTGGEAFVSVISAGFGCALWIGISSRAQHEGNGYMGQKAEGDGRMCNL